jgi:hypothetical protein
MRGKTSFLIAFWTAPTRFFVVFSAPSNYHNKCDHAAKRQEWGFVLRNTTLSEDTVMVRPLHLWHLTAALVLVPALALAGDRPTKSAKVAAPADSVEMFQAIKDGQIEVQLVPKDSSQCKVLIKNKTDKPLSVKLPEAFAGVPVLAQRGGGEAMMGYDTGGSSRSGGGYGNSGGNQGIGGGMGGMGGMGGYGGMGGMGGRGMMGGGFFNVQPEKVGSLKVNTVCLDHGKDDPRPSMKYEIKPIDQYSNKPAVEELCRMLGQNQVPQRVAQVAAWHLNNGMSWEQLAKKEIRHATGVREPYFKPQEIQAAMQIVSVANVAAEQRKAERESANTAVSQGSRNTPASQN